MRESWLPVSGYPGYEVSDQGNVRSLDRIIKHPRGAMCRKGVMLKVTTGRGVKPYRLVTLYGPKGRKPGQKICILMLIAFVEPKPFPKAVSRHLDDDSLNDVLSNLAWGTKADNVGDAIRNGRHRSACGERHPNARLTEDSVLAIRAAAAAGTRKSELASLYNVSNHTIGEIVRRKVWRHVQEPNTTPRKETTS